MLFWAVGLVPWKDTFYTAKDTPGCLYESCEEPNAELEALISILTAGPTAIGDAVNKYSRSFIFFFSLAISHAVYFISLFHAVPIGLCFYKHVARTATS